MHTYIGADRAGRPRTQSCTSPQSPCTSTPSCPVRVTIFAYQRHHQLIRAIPDLLTNFTSLPLPFSAAEHLPTFPASLREPTLELASSHLVCSVALTGVLALQAGRWWAEQADVDDDDEDITAAEDTGAETDRTESGKEKAKEPLRRREKATPKA